MVLADPYLSLHVQTNASTEELFELIEKSPNPLYEGVREDHFQGTNPSEKTYMVMLSSGLPPKMLYERGVKVKYTIQIN